MLIAIALGAIMLIIIIATLTSVVGSVSDRYGQPSGASETAVVLTDPSSMAASSEESGNLAENANDDNAATFWEGAAP